MSQLGHFLVLIGVVAVALAAVGALIGWYNEQGRRIRRDGISPPLVRPCNHRRARRRWRFTRCPPCAPRKQQQAQE